MEAAVCRTGSWGQCPRGTAACRPVRSGHHQQPRTATHHWAAPSLRHPPSRACHSCPPLANSAALIFGAAQRHLSRAPATSAPGQRPREAVRAAVSEAEADYKVFMRELTRKEGQIERPDGLVRAEGGPKVVDIMAMSDPSFGPALPEEQVPDPLAMPHPTLFQLLRDARDGKVAEFVFQKQEPDYQVVRMKDGSYVSCHLVPWFMGSVQALKDFNFEQQIRKRNVTCTVREEKVFDFTDQEKKTAWEETWLPIQGLLSAFGSIAFLTFFLAWCYRARVGENRAEVEKEALESSPEYFLRLGRSRQDARKETISDIKFKDVQGISEIVDELAEIVQYLKSPGQFDGVGARPPHGVLLYGPPGTGKTLIAKALAGEAGVPFYSMGGSEFSESHIGVGAARVRDLFLRAKAEAPAIIFIDELDGLGAARQRGGRGGGGVEGSISSGTQEREMTLNQLLTQLDGFDASEGIIFIGATNRIDKLDSALMRPGRLDRKINVRPADTDGRAQILRMHASYKKFDWDNIDIDFYARALPGASGADLANLLNEAAIMAVRRNGTQIELFDMNKALDRMIAGIKRGVIPNAAPYKRQIAIHELGTAMYPMILKANKCLLIDEVNRVSLEHRGNDLSRTIMERENVTDKAHERKPKLMQRMRLFLAGRAAEEVFYGRDVTEYKPMDLMDATALARKIIVQWAMEDRIPVGAEPSAFVRQNQFKNQNPYVGPSRDFENGLYNDFQLGYDHPRSQWTKDDLDRRTVEMVNKARLEVYRVLKGYKGALYQASEALLEREELNKYEIEAIIAANPPDQPWEELTAGEPYELWDRDWQNSPYLIKYGAFDLTSDLVPEYVRPLPKLPPNEQRLLDETREETSIMTQ
ncbi:ATP-dependent metalloprotease FtsH [Klebsormidium nitens]|uniref:ATP-dependent metalloprotease FtsH n=1 Tax=Klebsormidium nitens TaxID=105231 RepID=A0A1Y1I4M5_KLENI|nr:ATP-dependent metalloprotease FtsH [Klebsormidium nitens]|eukprot:GAQ84912.1 ATP-dependent metalloprotease FtsH [Klebsormidium nitens]